MKYVMFEVPVAPFLVHRIPVLFSDQINHADMAAAVYTLPGMTDARPVSAGFVDDHWVVFGGSFSMQLGSRAIDSQIIRLPQIMLTGAPTMPEPYKGVANQPVPALPPKAEIQTTPLEGWGTTKPEI